MSLNEYGNDFFNFIYLYIKCIKLEYWESWVIMIIFFLIDFMGFLFRTMDLRDVIVLSINGSL